MTRDGDDDALCTRQHVSLGALAPKHRPDAWQALFGKVHAITVADRDTFDADLTSVALGGMLVHRMRAAPQSVERTPAMIRRDGVDHFVLHLSTAPMQVSTQGRDIAIPHGAISVNDTARSFARAAAADRDSVSLVLARDLVAAKLPDTNGLHGTVLHRGAGALLIAHMRALAEGAPHIRRAGAAAAAAATADLFAACVLSTPDTVARARAPLEAAALIRAKSFIERNLGDVNLSPERVGLAINVSRATLFRLFAPLGGVARYIQDRRLTLVRRRLARRHRSETIARIGYEVGFSSDVHLSRAFRRKYGIAPTDIQPHAQGPDAEGSVGGDGIIEAWLAEYG